jgi:hypothetical protein
MQQANTEIDMSDPTSLWAINEILHENVSLVQGLAKEILVRLKSSRLGRKYFKIEKGNMAVFHASEIPGSMTTSKKKEKI